MKHVDAVSQNFYNVSIECAGGCGLWQIWKLYYRKRWIILAVTFPGVAAFLVKIIVCIVIYIIGKNVIGWVVKTVRSMLLRTKMQTGAATFIVSMLKIFLYLILIFGIAMQFGVKESSVAALVASGGVAIALALQGGLSNLAGGF